MNEYVDPGGDRNLSWIERMGASMVSSVRSYVVQKAGVTGAAVADKAGVTIGGTGIVGTVAAGMGGMAAVGVGGIAAAGEAGAIAGNIGVTGERYAGAGESRPVVMRTMRRSSSCLSPLWLGSPFRLASSVLVSSSLMEAMSVPSSSWPRGPFWDRSLDKTDISKAILSFLRSGKLAASTPLMVSSLHIARTFKEVTFLPSARTCEKALYV